MNRHRFYLPRIAGLLVIPALLSGCVLAPSGTREEQTRLKQAGGPYEPAPEQRVLPEIPSPATWQDVLHRAFLANGELESAYFDWKAAMARLQQAAAWPNSNVALGFEYMFSAGKMKAWDRTTVSAGFDPATSLQLPVKVRQAGKVALDEARAAGLKFRAVKFELQKRVLDGYLDLALMQEKIRIQQANVALLKLLVNTAANRVQAGGQQQDLLKAQTQLGLAENELASMQSQAQAMRAMLNGMLARDAQAPLEIPAALPPPRAVAAEDARLIAVAVDQNPELAGLAQQVAGRKDALTLARMRYIPDINPTAAFTGSISQAAGAMVMLPTNLPGIRGAIDEARAALRSNQAMLRQARRDRAASFVAALYAMRNAERQAAVFEKRIMPLAQQTLDSSRRAYAVGTLGFADLIDSQRTLLDVRRMIAEARIEREKRLAELEALAGVDIETLGRPTTMPASQKAEIRDQK